MIKPPLYWAKSSARQSSGRSRALVSRWGWSSLSQEDAASLAARRLAQALAERSAGRSVPAKEWEMDPYGIQSGCPKPLREQTVADLGPLGCVSRNGQGCMVLNSPGWLLVDVDWELPRFLRISGWMGAAAFAFGALGGLKIAGLPWLGAMLLACACSWVGARAGAWRDAKRSMELSKTAKREGLGRLRLAAEELGGLWRVYETPAGARAARMDGWFDPSGPEAAEAFKAFGSDPLYAKLCGIQSCFRARLSAKPWRMGGASRAGLPQPLRRWPQDDPGKAALRDEWILKYDEAASGFCAARFAFQVGSADPDPLALQSQLLHDAQACRPGTPIG